MVIGSEEVLKILIGAALAKGISDERIFQLDLNKTTLTNELVKEFPYRYGVFKAVSKFLIKCGFTLPTRMVVGFGVKETVISIIEKAIKKVEKVKNNFIIIFTENNL